MINRILNILKLISEIIAKNDDYNSVLTKIVKLLAKHLNVEVCSIYVYDNSSDSLILAATQGLNKKSVGKVMMHPGEGLTGVSFQENKILNISNSYKHPQFMFFKNTGEAKYKSFLAVPLTAGGNCLGVLTMQRIKPEKFSSSILDMAKSLSTQLANLILNAKMLNALSGNNGNGKSNHHVPENRKEQLLLRGIAANSGIAKGAAFIFKSRDFFHTVHHELSSDTEKELAVFDKAIALTKKKTLELEGRALSMISEADASIFHVHLLFLEDRTLLEAIKKEITANRHTAEYGIKIIFQEYQKRFKHLKDQAFREKVMDLKDVLLRLIETVRGMKSGSDGSVTFKNLPEKLILIAEELLPSDLIRMPIDRISGIACEKGGITAHVAILAKALNIPALMGIKEISRKARENDEILMDCHAELIYIRPTEQIKKNFEDLIRSGSLDETLPVDSTPCSTTDGVNITLRANISLICETSLLKKYGAQGIGLYRTEFLYMIRDYLPTEEDQYKVFSRIMKEAEGNEVTMRILDTGGDKPLPYMNFPKEDNPALGVRGTRLLLSREDILRPHLKAILRAGISGKLKILFPMISASSEIRAINKILAEIKDELRKNKIKFAENYKTGIMIEVPSILFDLDKLINEVDFMSIGSNDLLQYIFAADRGNEALSESFQSFHPLFLKILKQAGNAFSGRKDKTLSICGEFAGNPLAAPLLAGAGIYDLSMAPRRIPEVKKTLKMFSSEECRQLLENALKLQTPQEVISLLGKTITDKSRG